MLYKIKKGVGTFLSMLCILLINMQIAFATEDGTGVLEKKTATQVGKSLVDTIGAVLMPIGAAAIFITIAIVAFKLVMSANNPNERASAIASFPYILGGGLLLGGALLVAGLILNLAIGFGAGTP